MLVTYLDIDGVLSDYTAGSERFGFHLTPELQKELNQSGSKNPLKREMYEAVKGTDFYLRLPILKGADLLWDRVKKYNPIFLTASPKFGATEDDYYVNPYWLGAAYYKRRWIEGVFLPMMKYGELGVRVPIEDERFICTTSARKQEFMHRQHGPHQILVDDRIANCNAWAAAGGHAIRYIGAEDAIEALDEYEENPTPGTVWDSQGS